MKHLLPKAAQTLPHQPASPSGQRVLKETKRLHQVEQKNVGMKLCDQLCGKLNARNQLKLLWRFGDGDEGKTRQEAPAGGRAEPCLQLTPLCFVQPPQLCEQSPAHQPSLRISCFLSACIPGTVWNTALIMELAEKKPLLHKHVFRLFCGFPVPGLPL